MTDALLVLTAVLAAVAAVMAFMAFQRSKAQDPAETVRQLYAALEPRLEKLETTLQRQNATEAAFNREEAARQARDLREEQSNQAQKLRDEVRGTIGQLTADSRSNFEALGSGVKQQLADFATRLDQLTQAVNTQLSKAQQQAQAEFAQNRKELTDALNQFSATLNENTKQMDLRLQSGADRQADALRDISKAISDSLQTIRQAVEHRLAEVQQNNAEQLEKMRQTVDEKLQSTLEKRLGESFQLVSDRLEQVHKGLGEMQNLASGVGDLKRVLTNVKSRGSFGEVQLAALLEEMLTAEQFDRNVKTKPRSNDLVEFAIKLPGRSADGQPVYLPVDAKFPTEDYERLLAAHDAGDKAAENEALKGLRIRILGAAKDIRDKYIEPPYTTDFGIMYLPTEGLYAEVLRMPGLASQLQREFRVIPTGPTTLSAILSSLQMGFRTLAIEQRSSEVWKVLGAVKSEFGKFGDLLEKAQEQIEKASETISTLRTTRSNKIRSKLKGLEEMPADEAARLLGLGSGADFTDAEE